MLEEEMKRLEAALRATYANNDSAFMSLDTAADILCDLRGGASAEDIIEDLCLDMENGV